MNKNQKKALLQKYKEEQRENFIKSLPMPAKDFRALFDFLDETDDDCKDKFSHTIDFLNTLKCDSGAVLAWLVKNGAGCDCEVLYNIEEQFEEFEVL